KPAPEPAARPSWRAAGWGGGRVEGDDPGLRGARCAIRGMCAAPERTDWRAQASEHTCHWHAREARPTINGPRNQRPRTCARACARCNPGPPMPCAGSRARRPSGPLHTINDPADKPPGSPAGGNRGARGASRDSSPVLADCRDAGPNAPINALRAGNPHLSGGPGIASRRHH
ncbi:MAG: hypothetical protein J3K34DRAFT_420608, partial [Monoraphidium minutum]